MKRGGLALYWSAILVAFFVLGYFILANAQMLIGDELPYVTHICTGKAFPINDQIQPEGARFFPFAYQVYNVLLLFSIGSYHIPAVWIYVVHLVLFAVLLFSFALVFKTVFNDKGYGLLISLFAVLALAFRSYPYYLQCGSTLPVSLSIWSLFVLFSCLIFTKRPSFIYICGSLICVNFLLYTGEPHFVIPLTFGAFCLIFYYKSRSRAEKLYAFALTASCFVFLLLYLVLILPNITGVYDPSHGSNINRFANALKMTWATKIMVLSILWAIVRFFHIVSTKEPASVFDLLLFSSVAFSLASFVLGLNYTMYYVVPVLISFVAVLYYSYQYIGHKFTLCLSLAFFLLCSYSLPGKIESRQRDRVTTKQDVYALYDYFKKEQDIYWYKPSLEFAEDKESDGKRDLQYESLVQLVRWETGDSTFYMKKVKSFSDSLKGIWLNSIHNERYCKTDTLSMINYPVVFTSGEINGYLVQ